MSVFQSKIQWNFKDFEVNTVWESQKAQRGEIISSDQIKQQKLLSKKQNLSALIKNIDPFSLISQDLDLRVWDKKKRVKKEGNVFDFSKASGYFGNQNNNQLIKEQKKSSTNVKVIDDLNNYLVQNWGLCDKLISSLQKDQHPLAKILTEYIIHHGSLEVNLIGSNPVAVNKREKVVFFAIKYFDQSENLNRLILSNFDNFQTETHLISKYIVFCEQLTLYELELSVSFTLKEDIQSNPEVFTSIIQVKDCQNFFQNAFKDLALNKLQLLSNYSFISHGDYLEYPYKEQLANKRKFMKQESYSLAFQGGGAKGVAYVGAYSAIREMKKQGKSVPITSIMGSSAGGIIALAVSTNIDPYEVQKICYKMGKIPKEDRIDRKYLLNLREKYPTNQAIDEQAQKMLQRLIILLNDYGILQRPAIDQLRQFIRKLDKKKVALVFKRLVEFFLASNQSIGQIFDYKDGDFQQFNYLGLLLEGALMRGEAIHEIGSECLIKYILLNDQQFFEERRICQLGDKLSKQLKDHVSNFDVLCQRTLLVPLEKIVGKIGTRTLFTIINKIFMVFDRNLAIFHKNDTQRFIIDERFAQTLQKYFEYKPIYSQKPYPDQFAQSIKDNCSKLYKIVFNHHRIHPNSKEMGVKDSTQKEPRLHAITEYLEKNHEIRYETLTQFLAEEYFLDSKNFTLKEEHRKLPLKDLLIDIFRHKGDERIFDDKLFVRELAQLITQTLTPDTNLGEIEQISRYREHFQSFKKTVQKITLSTYYKLTKIQLTCTSVDLQNKVLRFFNHKTTPDLTVCRAVQMTGSFPVGFQAQTWKPQWGNYFIHYDDYRRQVLLTGHQFTDGGMLANFPMKYFDNDYISDCYFSHRINRSLKNDKHPYETIMLGFGLDKLETNRYTQSQGQIYRGNITQKESAKAKAMLMKALVDAVGYTGGTLNMVSLGLKLKGLLDAFRYPKATQIQWSRIQPNLISDIPLFNFVAKLLNSYPKADRNLNLQCFKDRIYQTKMIKSQKQIQQKTNERRLKLLSYIQCDEKKQLIKDQIFTQEKSSWLPGWFNRGKNQDKVDISENVKALSDIITGSINQTPLTKYFLNNIKESFDFTLRQQEISNAKLEVKAALNLKRKIKQQLFSIILNRMKLDLSDTDLQMHTLIFFSLRYSNKAKPDLNELSLKKFEGQIKRQYYGIEQQLPFQKFKQKMFEAELITNFNRFDPSIYSEEELKKEYDLAIQQSKRSVIQQKKKYILNQLDDNDKREYLNLSTFYLSQSQRFLLQYIFLSKLNVEDLDYANQFLRKTSFKQILLHYESKGNDWYSYITIKDLKAFYRRLFSKNKQKYPCKYDKNTLLERQQLLQYERQEQIKQQLNDRSIRLANKFNQTIYLQRGITINDIHSQLLEIQKSNVQRIQFIRIIRQVFSSGDNRNAVKTALADLIAADPNRYNKLLVNLLYPNEKKKIFQDAYFRSLLNNQELRKYILTLLFNQNGQYFNQNEYVINIYNIQFQRFKLKKEQILKDINQMINRQAFDKKQKGNSLQVQTTYLDNLQEQIGFKLLIKRLKSAIKRKYYLKDADLSSGMGVQTDRKYRQAIRNQINSEQDYNSIIYKEMISKAYKYQANIHIFEQYIRSIRFSIKNFQSLQSKKNVPFVQQIVKASDIMIKNFVGIRHWLIHQFNRINKMPVESIKMYHLQEVYSLDYDGFKGICQQLILTFKIIQGYLNQKNNPEKLDNIDVLKKVKDYIQYFDNNNFQLPHFETVWSIYMREFKFKEHSSSLLRSLNKQFTNTYVSKIAKNNPEIKVHLILQGCDLSNNYYAYYYQLFSLFKQNLETTYQQTEKLMPYMIQKNASLLKIRAVTTSSYHSIFGFLMALNYSTCHLKNQMSAIREIAQHLQSKQSVQQYFDSYKWCNITSQDYKQFWSYIKAEKYNFFRQLQKLANKSLPSHKLTSQFSEIRSIYEHQQDKIMKYCEDILDDVTSNIELIDSKVDDRYQALQISQRYAYNYTCSFNKQHQYGVISEHSYGLYQKIVKRLFTAYGSLLEAIITNAYSAQAKIQLPNSQQGFICKAFLVKQMLSTFKLKEFVINKLKQNNLRQNISLADFFNQAPNKILLNFTTINVHKARLEFMNKNTLPNMPLWAAIVSASCLPYFYNDFQCPREWQNASSDVSSLYELIVDGFFASNIMDYKKAKYTSGNIVSSIPMELLTNQTTLLKMFSYEKDPEPYLHLGYSFNSNENNYKKSTFKLKRNYLEVSLLEDIPLLMKVNPPVKFNKNCNKDNEKHKNLTYESQAGLMSKLSAAKSKSEFSKYIGILTQSNDNFILYMYWNRLIRLPIKIDTLDFHEITDKFLEKTYGVNVASGKTKNTVERSYEISKYFQRSYFGNEQNRYLINMRITIIDKQPKIYGASAYFAKIQLLSHSKWNRNRYNNFLVQYALTSDNFGSAAKNAPQSEILWNLCESSKIYLRFYVPKYAQNEYNKSQYSSIQFSQVQFDLSEIINELPLKNSYDYTFNFYQCIPKNILKGQPGLKYGQLHKIPPFKKNQIPLNRDSQKPALCTRLWYNTSEGQQKPYIRPILAE